MTKDIIKFTKPSGRYNAGDVAGFDPITAQSYKAAGVAVTYVPPSTSVAALSAGGDVEEGMRQVREFARSERDRLHILADGIQRREAEINEKLEARERAVATREDDVARREAALDQGQASGSATTPIIAADQKGPMPPNGATPPTGEGHEGEVVTENAAKGEEAKDDLPFQGQARKGK